MAPTRSASWWTTYFSVYFGGLAVLINQTHGPGAAPEALWLPFALPPILVWIAMIADRVEGREPPPPPSGQVSVVTGRLPFEHGAPRTVGAVGMAMMTPFTSWIFPESSPPSIRLAFLILTVVCAVFTSVVIPRLQPRVTSSTDSPR